MSLLSYFINNPPPDLYEKLPKLHIAFVEASLMCWENEHIIDVKSIMGEPKDQPLKVESEQEIEKGLHLFLMRDDQLPKRVIKIW